MVYPDNIPKKWLVWEWLFDGNANDSSGNWNDGSWTDITWVDAERGYVKEVASFNGSSSYIDIPASLFDGKDNVWIWFWVNITWSTWETQYIFQRSKSWTTDDFVIWYNDTDNNFWCKVKDTAINWPVWWVELNKYYYIYLYYNWSDFKFYINWELVWTESKTWTLYTWVDATRIWNNQNKNRWTKWNIWLFRVYYNEYSSKQLFNLYLEGLRKLWPNLLQQYPELFRWCVWYWDFRWDASNLITWEIATVNGATLTTDHLGYNNSAYSFDGSDDYIDTWISVWNHFTVWWIVEYDDVSWSWTTRWASERQSAWEAKWWYFRTDWDWQVQLEFYADWGTYFHCEWGWALVAWKRYTIYAYIDNVNKIAKIFKDWVEVGSTTFTWSLDIWTWNLTLWYQPDNYFPWTIYQIYVTKNILSASHIKQLYQLTSKKYIYPFAKYTPASLPKPILHINWNRNGDTFYDQS